METFSFFPPISLPEEEKLFLTVTSFETTNSVFIIFDENNCSSNSIPGRWRTANYLEDEIIDKMNSLLKLASQNDLEKQVKEVRKKEIKKNRFQRSFFIGFLYLQKIYT